MKIGIASLAHVHAGSYATLLAANPEVELLIAEPDTTGPWNATFFDTYDDMLAAHPDGVVVCTENVRHREVVEAAAAAGAYVLCEKPLATTVVDAEAMIAACAAAKVGLMTAYPVRFSPAVRTAQLAVESGQLGKILTVTGLNNGRLPRERAWFTDPDLAGGGALMDHTVHLADIFSLLVSAPPVEVFAQTNRILHADTAGVETGGLVVIRYADGTVASIDCSWSRPDGFPTWGGLSFEILGERGIVQVDAFGQAVTGFGADGRNLWLSYGPDLDRTLLDTFLTSVRERRRADPDGEQGLATLRIVSAAYESARTGQPVRVDARS
jgi:predicted dehydrogenase